MFHLHLLGQRPRCNPAHPLINTIPVTRTATVTPDSIQTPPGQDNSVWIEMPHALKDAAGNITNPQYFDGIQDEILPMGPTGFLSLRWIDFVPSYTITAVGYDDAEFINDYWNLINTYSSGNARPIPTPTFHWPTLWINLSSLTASLEARYAITEDQTYQVYHDEGYATSFSPLNLSGLGDELYSPDDGTWRDVFSGFELLSGARHAFYLVRRGKPIASTLLTLPGGGLTNIGIRTTGNTPTTGPITIGGVTIDVGASSGSITFPNGGTISVNSGVVSVSGFPGVASGPITGNVSLGALGSVQVDTAGNATITVGSGVPAIGGAVITANASGGGSITLSNGAGISISSSGRMGVTLPPGTDPTIVQIMDIAAKVLSIGAGAVIEVRDILGNVIPLPTSGILGAVGAAITSKGRFEVGVKLGNDSWFWFDVYTFGRPQLAVDADRDGQISFAGSDATSAPAPYRFWLNDDDDDGFKELKWIDADPERYPPITVDSANQIIDGARDCEDLTRIWINAAGLIDTVKDLSSDLYLGLKWKNTNGTYPSIRLFRAADPNGGLGHIKDALIGAQQAGGVPASVLSMRTCLGDADAQAIETTGSYPWSGIAQVEPGIGAADFIFRKDALSGVFGNRPTGYLLFEGVREGKGELTVVVVRKKSDNSWEKVSDGGSVWLQLDNIRRMYVRAHATPTDPNFLLPWRVSTPAAWPYEESAVATEDKALSVPDARLGYAPGDSQEDASASPFVPFVGEQAKCVVFVHGIDLAVSEQQGYAQSFFKRIWWEGFRGRFIAFRWSTPLSSDGLFGWGDEGTSIYNSGEYRAFKGGTSLRKFVAGLGAPGNPFYLGSGALIGLAAHSQGNIVAGEALRQGMQVNNYVALEAAVPLSCYYPSTESLPAFPRFSEAEFQRRTTASHIGVSPRYSGYFASLGSSAKTSYHNKDDFWLVGGTALAGFFETNWIANNAKYKPDGARTAGNYRFDFSKGPFFERSATTLRGITDAHEAMAFVSRSMTLALGAVAPPPMFGSQVNLQTQYTFGPGRPDHSGQFQRDIQLMYGSENGTPWRDPDGSEQPLYLRLMRDLGVQP